MTNPSRYWAELAAKNPSSQELCEGIVDILIHHCFSEDAAPVNSLRQAMPIIYTKLTSSNPDTRSSSIALDAARTTGLFDISKCRKEDEMRLIFEAAIIMLLYLRTDLQNYNYPYASIPDFLREYSHFGKESEDEIIKLFNFANCMKVAIQLIKPKLHKSQLLVLCTRLTEGKSVKYVTGSGQKPETKRRVEIYEHEGGCKAEPRPWRVSWNLITQILSDENETVAEVDISQRLMSQIQDQPDMKDVEMNHETLRFRHPSVPNVHIETTEMKSATGQTLMRAMSLSHVKEDDKGNVVEATELHREFSITGEVTGDSEWLNEFDEALLCLESLNEGDISVSRQSVKADGQLVKGITVAKQFPEAIENVLSESQASLTPTNEDSIFDFLGGSLTRQFSGGAYGLIRSLSTGSPRPNAPASLLAGLNSSPRVDMVGNWGLATGLSRMNSSNCTSFGQLNSASSCSGLIRSFSGGYPGQIAVSAQPTPILSVPNSSSTGIVASEMQDYQHDAKRIKLEVGASDAAADASNASTKEWGDLYKSIAK